MGVKRIQRDCINVCQNQKTNIFRAWHVKHETDPGHERNRLCQIIALEKRGVLREKRGNSILACFLAVDSDAPLPPVGSDLAFHLIFSMQ